MTAPGWCSCHFGLTWIPFAPQISQWICLPIQSCLLLYSFWASLGHSCTMGLIVSSALLSTLHIVCSCELSIFPLIRLVWMACSWAAHIKLSVSRLRVPFHNHCHLSWFHTSLVYHTNWPCNIFSSQEIFLFSFFCFLASIVVSWIGWIKSISKDLSAARKRSLGSLT